MLTDFSHSNNWSQRNFIFHDVFKKSDIATWELGHRPIETYLKHKKDKIFTYILLSQKNC